MSTRSVGRVRPISPHRTGVPLASSPVAAGFPSPADDYLEPPLDIHARLVRNPSATFLVEVEGDSMKDAGIFAGDIMVVDKSVEPRDGNIVIALVNTDFTVKRLRCPPGGPPLLIADNPAYPPIVFREGDEMSIWGVVRHVIKDV